MDKQTILIVDDDIDLTRELGKNLLEINDQYVIIIADDGKKALEVLEKEKPDLVIMEIQIPVINGMQLLTELHNREIWLPIIIITDSNINEKDRKLLEFGIVDFIKKPFLPEKVVLHIDQIMKNREKKDLIKSFGLPSILQLIEMDKRTGILNIKIGKENGRLFFKEGKVMDIEVKGLSSREALEEFMNSLYEDNEISIEYINHRKEQKINMTLMQMVMEATRLKDEKKIPQEKDKPGKKTVVKSDHLLKTADLLDCLKEIEGYIITDTQGEVLTASPGDYSKEVLNSGIYLWVTGDKLGSDFHLGEPSYFTCYCKARKRLIRKFGDLLIILHLSEMTKYSAFKEKLNELLKKSFL